MNSSWSSRTMPFWSATGTSDLPNSPSARALAAFCWERRAKASTSARLKPSRVAIRSAPIPCGTKLVCRLVSGSSAQAPPSEPIGTRDMDSTPPTRTRSSKPERTFIAPQVHRLQAGGAETVDLHAGNLFVPVGHQRRGLGDIGTLVAHRRHAAEHDIVDLGGIQVVAPLDRAQQPGHQVHRLDAVQRAILLALAAGSTHGVVNECVGHGGLSYPVLVRPSGPPPTFKQARRRDNDRTAQAD